MVKERVVVAMSGGVDSSVAAAMLKEEGYEVIGITMCFGTSLHDTGSKNPACCGLDAIDDAKRVASQLGIKHYVLNFGKIFKEKVIDDFIINYVKGLTPNPCIRCNQFIKFDALFQKAKGLGAEYLATGHFARIEFDKAAKNYFLQKGKDKRYDQSYFLYALKSGDLKHFLLPLGKITKEKVRAMAQSLKLSVAQKPSSQDICFGSRDYRSFLKNHVKELQPGEIRLSDGSVVGQHNGLALYTIGQREGLGVALGKPQYVHKIDAKNNVLYIGDKEECLFKGCLVKEINFPGSKPPRISVIEATVKIRYNHREAACKVRLQEGNKARITFAKPQFAVTPGQAAVVYQKDKVIFGGKITEAIK